MNKGRYSALLEIVPEYDQSEIFRPIIRVSTRDGELVETPCTWPIMRITPYKRQGVNRDFVGQSPGDARPLLSHLDGKELLTVIIERLDKLESTLHPSAPATPHLTAKEAAAYLRISYSTFRKKATRIRRQPGTGRYRIEDLNEFAASQRSKRKR
jgi:hypothetical protein